MLTLTDLKQYERGIFASGQKIVKIEEHDGIWLKWVAVRGQIHDWAIYAVEGTFLQIDSWSWNKIAASGDKIHTRSIVKELVVCDNEALEWYRD